MSGKSLHRRDIRHMSRLEKLKALALLKKLLLEAEQTGEYKKLNELAEKEILDEKEINAVFEELTKICGLRDAISHIEEELGLRLSDSQIRERRHRRAMAKASARALENGRKREEFEARDRERIRNLPPIDKEEQARIQKTVEAYLEYRERAKRLKKEVIY